MMPNGKDVHLCIHLFAHLFTHSIIHSLTYSLASFPHSFIFNFISLHVIIRDGEWSFKKSGSLKVLAEFQGSRSLVFSADLRSRSLDFFRNVQKSQMSWSCNLKSGKALVSQRKTLVSPSRKVSILPFTTPIIGDNNKVYFYSTHVLCSRHLESFFSLRRNFDPFVFDKMLVLFDMVQIMMHSHS